MTTKQPGPLSLDGMPTCDMCGALTPVASLREVVKSSGCILWVCNLCDPSEKTSKSDENFLASWYGLEVE